MSCLCLRGSSSSQDISTPSEIFLNVTVKSNIATTVVNVIGTVREFLLEWTLKRFCKKYKTESFNSV